MRPKQPDPIPEMKRAIAGALIAKLQGWTQEKAAALLRTSQPTVSNLRNTKLHRFSLEQLIRMTTRVHGYAYVEIRFRHDHIGPSGTTRAPAGEPPDFKHLTWSSSPQDGFSEPPQAR